MPPLTPPTPEQRSAYRQRFVISDDKFTPLYVLAPDEFRAPGALVAAMALLQAGEYELLVAGEHDSPERVLANVRYLGVVENIEQLYSACDITLALSGSAFADQSVIESLCCGTPVLISKKRGVAGLLSNNECLLLDDIRAESIATSLRQARRMNFDIPADFAKRQAPALKKHIAAR